MEQFNTARLVEQIQEAACSGRQGFDRLNKIATSLMTRLDRRYRILIFPNDQGTRSLSSLAMIDRIEAHLVEAGYCFNNEFDTSHHQQFIKVARSENNEFYGLHIVTAYDAAQNLGKDKVMGILVREDVFALSDQQLLLPLIRGDFRKLIPTAVQLDDLIEYDEDSKDAVMRLHQRMYDRSHQDPKYVESKQEEKQQ